MRNIINREKYILGSFILVIAVLLKISYEYTQVDNLVQREIKRLDNQLDLLMRDHISHVNDKYNAIAKNYQNNQTVMNLIKNRDRVELYKELKNSYKSMLDFDPHLYVMHIHDTNTTTILRVHKPETYDDNLADIRPMISDTNRYKKSYSGFEVGRNGITYRVSSPLFKDNKECIGVLEFGIKPSYFTSEIADIIDVKAQLIVKSKSIKVLTKKVSYESFGDFSIINPTPFFKKLTPFINLDKEYQILNTDGKNYVVFNNISLNNYNDMKEAHIVFIKDITTLVKKNNHSLLMIYIINLMIILIVIFLFFRGIKNRKQLENSLKELNTTLEDKVQRRTDEQNTLLSLFDKGDSVLFKWKNDDIWSVEFASLGVSELLGYSLTEIMSNEVSYASCIHKDDLERVISEVTQASESKESYFKHKPYRVITKNKKIKWVLDTTIIVTDGDKISHYIGHISDITKLVSIEKQLLQQSKMAQMGELISMIAHQWRQPLGAISAVSIDLNMKIELEAFDKSSKEGVVELEKYLVNSLSQIDSLVQNLTTTIDDFRNFYKSDKQKESSTINIPINKAYAIVKSSLQSSNVKIIREYLSKDILSIYSNEFMQVILNILQNSQDNFIEVNKENPIIKIKTYDIKELSIIEISDNGGGIDKSIIDEIFNPYFSTKTQKNGTGLGLYMSKTIVEEHHNGIITVDNIDDGVLFRIKLFKEEDKS